MRLTVSALDKVCASGLDPRRIYRGNHARIYARRFHQAAGNNPFWRLRCQWCTRRNDESQTTWAVVFALFVEISNRPEESRQNGLMQIGVTGGGRIGTQLELADPLRQLRMQLLPLAHAHKRQEMLPAP